MTKTRYFGELEVEETDSRFQTYDAIRNEAPNKVHHDRISAKFQDEDQESLESIAIQPFVDESTPHGRMGVQLDPAHLDDVIDALEAIRIDHLME